MSMHEIFKISEEHQGKRLDVIISELFPDLSRSSLKTRLKSIFINAKQVKLSHKAKVGEEVSFNLKEMQTLDLSPEDIPLDIVYQDEDIAVINKQPGLAVHPAQGNWEHTLVHGLLYHLGDKLSGIGGVERPGIVHRLDKDTSGLMIIALSDKAHKNLVESFKMRTIEKHYEAIIMGHPEHEGEIIAPIGRSSRDRKKMAVRQDGKEAHTSWKVLEYFEEHAYITIRLYTGRTHQIRVHFSHKGFPLLGDPIYSRSPKKGLALCARRLKFQHPVTGKELSFECGLPPHFTKYLDVLRKS